MDHHYRNKYCKTSVTSNLSYPITRFHIIRHAGVYITFRMEKKMSKQQKTYWILNPLSHKTGKHGMRAALVITPQDQSRMATLVAYSILVMKVNT